MLLCGMSCLRGASWCRGAVPEGYLLCPVFAALHRGCCVQLEVFPDEEIRLVNANQVPDDDYASVFDGVAGAQAF